MRKYRSSVRWAVVAAALFCLSGCHRTAAPVETTQPPKIEKLSMVVTGESIHELTEYPDLKQADLTGSTCYDAIEDYIASHPDVEVHYTVSIGDSAVAPDTTELALREGDYDYDTLLKNISYLHDLKVLVLPETQLSAAQIAALAEASSDVTIEYSVEILGELYGAETQAMDLSAMRSEDVQTVAQQLTMLPCVEQVELLDAQGNCPLSIEEVALLQRALPRAVFSYTFDLFGQKISTTDREVIFRNKKIGNQGEPQIRQALDIMGGCEYLLLENCRIDNEIMASIRDDYRDRTKVVWRVHFGRGGSCLTDREMIRFVYGLNDSNCHDLIYCEDARFIDFGHNSTLTDVSYVASMKKLEAIIISGAPIRDLSAFANCESLVFLEAAYCNYVDDITPLAQCKNLKMLNISYTHVSDLSPVADLALEKLCSTHSMVSEEDRRQYTDAHPDCIVQFEGSQPYGYPWRYEKDGVTRNEYYAMLRKVFNYDNAKNTIW